MTLIPLTELLRMQRARDFAEAMHEWQASHGDARTYWRIRVRGEIARERARLADTLQRMHDAAPHTITRRAA
jgi:hypothetical protein